MSAPSLFMAPKLVKPTIILDRLVAMLGVIPAFQTVVPEGIPSWVSLGDAREPPLNALSPTGSQA